MANQIQLPQLNSSNFNNWKFRVKSILEEKQLLITLEKEIEDFSDEKEKFIIKDVKAKSIIVQCLTDKHLDIIKDAKTAKLMMKCLQDVFERQSVFTKLTLKRKLLTLKCGYKEKLEDHFLKFDSLIRELESVGSKLDESDKVCHLLSLNDDYESVVTAIETLNTDITMEFVKSRLLDEELKRINKGQSSNNENNEVAFKAFPFTCYNCGEKGHKAAECHKNNSVRGRSIFRRGNQRNRGRSHTPRLSRVYKAEDKISFVALHTEQLENETNTIFILDSGATQHIVSDKLETFMTDVNKMGKQITIHIANGEKMIAEKKGGKK